MKPKLLTTIALLMLATTFALPLAGQTLKPKKQSKITYHNGQVMLGTNHLYFIMYGNWEGSNTPDDLVQFAISLNESSYTNINTTYYDAFGARVSNSYMWGRNTDDLYSRGTNLTDADVEAIVNRSIMNGQLPHDPQGLYFVVASPDVDAAGLCTDYCEFHDVVSIAGVGVKYAFIGNPQRCPSKCAPQLSGPSGNYATDAIINWVAHNIAGMVTSPNLDGWFDRLGRENSDKCVGIFGPTYQAPNGTLANINLRGRDYLLQYNWVNDGNGYCALTYP